MGRMGTCPHGAHEIPFISVSFRIALSIWRSRVGFSEASSRCPFEAEFGGGGGRAPLGNRRHRAAVQERLIRGVRSHTQVLSATGAAGDEVVGGSSPLDRAGGGRRHQLEELSEEAVRGCLHPLSAHPGCRHTATTCRRNGRSPGACRHTVGLCGGRPRPRTRVRSGMWRCGGRKTPISVEG